MESSLKKQAYQKYYDEYGLIGEYPIKLTGKCKIVHGGPNNPNGGTKYYQRYVTMFGFPVRKEWVRSDFVRWYEKETVEYYECDDVGLNDD